MQLLFTGVMHDHPFLQQHNALPRDGKALSIAFARWKTARQETSQQNACKGEADNAEYAGGIQGALPCQKAERQQENHQKKAEKQG